MATGSYYAGYIGGHLSDTALVAPGKDGDGSSLRVTFARWYPPRRQEIHQKGLTPDVLVTPADEDVQAGRDPQLDRAVAVLLERAGR